MDKQAPPKIIVCSLGNGRYSWRLVGGGLDEEVAAWGFAESEELARTLAETAYEHCLVQRRKGRQD